jgi:phage terminase large subunit-like protein
VQHHPELSRVVVAVDPSGGDSEENDEVGIGAAGIGMCPCKVRNPWDKPELHGFVLEDASDILSPAEWAQRSARLYHARKADRLVAETNFGGDMVESNIRTLGDPSISFRGVTASRGKQVRAEPVSALYEQGKVHHVGAHPKLEDEMTQWNPLTDTRSPNRVDWLVWALTDLMLTGSGPVAFPVGFRSPKRRI